MSQTFTCKRCGKRKPIADLSQSGTGPRPACKPCEAAYHRRLRKESPRVRQTERLYNMARQRALEGLAITHRADFQRLLELQLTQVGYYDREQAS